MDRRNFVKAVLATGVAGAVVPEAVGDTNGKKYESDTITVELIEGETGITLLALTEHGDADYVIVEAFYYTMFNGVRTMKYIDTSTPLGKGVTMGADLPLPVTSIEFIRVKEMKMVTQSEFGKVPKFS